MDWLSTSYTPLKKGPSREWGLFLERMLAPAMRSGTRLASALAMCGPRQRQNQISKAYRCRAAGPSAGEQRPADASAREQRSTGESAREQHAASAQGPKGPTLCGHIGFVLPLVTHSGGQTTSLADQPAVGFPVGITVKGSGRTAFDLEFVPQYNATGQRLTTLTVHPGLIYSLGHGYAVGLRAAFVVDNPTVGFTPLVNKSWPIKHNNSLFKAYFVEADLPVRFSRPVGAPATNAVTFAMHFGVAF
jgi:hypothetical protein